jgi:two-component system sensor histidine kinase EvgS
MTSTTFLAVVLGYAELMIQKLSPDDPMHTDAEEIRNAAERAAGLTGSFSCSARKQTVQPVVLDLNEVLESLDKMLRQLVDEDIELTMTRGKDVCPIRGDAGYVGQVLMNLVVNARDAMPEGASSPS